MDYLGEKWMPETQEELNAIFDELEPRLVLDSQRKGLVGLLQFMMRADMYYFVYPHKEGF